MSRLDPHLAVGGARAETPRRVLHVGPSGQPAWLLYEGLAAAGHEVSVWEPVATDAVREAAHVGVAPDARGFDVVVVDAAGWLLDEAAEPASELAGLGEDVRVVQLRGPREIALERRGVVLRIGETYSARRAPWLEALVEGWGDPAWLTRHVGDPVWTVHLVDLARATVLAVERGEGETFVAPAQPATVGEMIAVLAPRAAAFGLPSPAPLPRESLSETMHLGGLAAGRKSAAEVLGWAPVADPTELTEPALQEIARRRLDGGSRRGARRSFRLQEAWWRLVEDPEVAAADRSGGRVTVVPVEGGAPQAISAAQLGSVPGSAASRTWSPRGLTEEVLERGFDDAWLHEIIGFAARHGLLTDGEEGS